MLHVINSITDSWFDLIKDDPVRPEIPGPFRVSGFSEIFCSVNQGRAAAVTCVAYRDSVPKTVEELLCTSSVNSARIAVFYTIWSYLPGSGAELIFQARDWIRQHRPEIEEFVTLSPPTDMARKFHLRNGAAILSVNEQTINYQYYG